MKSEVSEVKSLSEYLAALSDIRVKYDLSSDPNYAPLLLRGEDKLYSFPCSSRAARMFREPKNSFSRSQPSQTEINIVSRWKDSCERLEEVEYPRNRWVLTMRAGHHGLATRLTDWTTNPLVALWFASCKTEEGDGAIYIVVDSNLLDTNGRGDKIHVVRLDELIEGSTPQISSEEFYERKPITSSTNQTNRFSELFIVPPRDFFQRISRQNGLFHVAADVNKSTKYSLKIVVPFSVKKTIQAELRHLRVDADSLKLGTPDSIASDLNRFYE